MLIVGHGLAELPLRQVVIRCIGAAIALSAGYWAFFEKDAEQPPSTPGKASLDLTTILLLSTLALQAAPAIVRLTQFADTAWFYVACALSGILLGGLSFAVVSVKRCADDTGSTVPIADRRLRPLQRP